jgi:hypothetical protein
MEFNKEVKDLNKMTGQEALFRMYAKFENNMTFLGITIVEDAL